MGIARSLAVVAVTAALVAPAAAGAAGTEGRDPASGSEAVADARNGYSSIRVTPKRVRAWNGGVQVLDGDLYFPGLRRVPSHAAHVELWRTSPDTGGEPSAEQVTDIAPRGSATPSLLTTAGDALYFTAFDRSAGRELWRYRPGDGEAERLTDLDDAPVDDLGDDPDPTDPEPDGSSRPQDLTPVGDLLLFSADHGRTDHRRNLYALDTGTGEVAMVGSDDAGPLDPRDLVVVGDQVLYSASGAGYRRQLWRTDTGTGVTERVAGIAPSPLVTVDDRWVYFFGNDGKRNDELWRFDTETGEAELVRDLDPGPSAGAPSELVVAGDVVYFVQYDGEHGSELWSSDAATGRTRMVDDIRPGSRGSSPFWLTPTERYLYLNADDGRTGAELWRTRIGSGRATQVADLRPGSRGSFPLELGEVAGTVYSTARRSTSPRGTLWATDALTGHTEAALGAKRAGNLGPIDVDGEPYFVKLSGAIIHLRTPTDG